METPKILPKKAYSLNDAVKYISSNHNIEISKKDLLEYFQSGDIQFSIHLSGNINGIKAINRKEVDCKNPLLINEHSIFANIDTEALKPKISFSSYDDCIQIKVNNGNVDILFLLREEFYIYDDLKKCSRIKLHNGEINHFCGFFFGGYFPLDISFIDEYNIDQLLDIGYFDEFQNVTIKTEEFYLYFAVEENRTKIHLDDICILHRDLVEFLEMFSIIDRKYNQIEEISSLKEKVKELSETIAEKDNQIAKLKSQLAEENRPILLGEHRKDDLLKIAIEVRKKYWSNYPENIKSNIQIRDYIKRDYGIATTTAEEIEKIACPINRTKNKK
ncbi:SlyX protein [Lonepinella sp. BR2919]|uniref:SlyX protein n=1 Tax=unclassified Lonepinella TaxID=2642006 RepID=UPI003F6DAF7F